MRIPLRSLASAGLVFLLGSCSGGDILSPPRPGGALLDVSATLPPVRISELHYDNDGTDTGEAIEVSAPAGTDLSGWSLVLYNGNGGVVYDTNALSGTVADACDGRGVFVQEYSTNGVQNGSPDGVALVDATGAVVEFLSYEGAITAVDGPANGMTSTDIGASESSSTTAGSSLQRDGSDSWHAAPSTFGACNDASGGTTPPPADLPATRFSELHYDNNSTDAGEAIEVEGPAGTDLSGWSIVLYNGNGGGAYETLSLGGTIPATCDDRGVISLEESGIQNGPDALALVDGTGAVVEFLSYEGSVAATDGPAIGLTSTDIGVEEGSDTPEGQSLQRDASGAWQAPQPATFGECNGGLVTPPTPGATTVVIDELMGNPVSAYSPSWGEWFEVHNYGTEAVDLRGWTIVSDSVGSESPEVHVISKSVVVQPGGYAVLGRSDDFSRNGGVTVDYDYYDQNATPWLDAADWLVLRSPAGATVDSVRWSALPEGATRALRDASQGDPAVDGSGWGYSTTPFGDGDYGTPGAKNTGLSNTAPEPPVVHGSVSIFGHDSSDPPLPVGFEDQLFASYSAHGGGSASTIIAWSSDTPDLAKVDQDGVVHARGAGTAIIRATASDSSTATFEMPIIVATASTTASYVGNAEFGEPTRAGSNDFIVRRAQYVSAFNPARGTPDWVSYDLDASAFGSQDRCNCFTADPQLPATFTHITTADYTGAGGYAGYGIDRGHLARSADRTAGTLDNATTFYFSNIIPQAADLNRGPWAALETHLGDLARDGTHEVYIIAGVQGNQGTVKGEGKLVIPERVWKVALIMPRDEGLDDVHDPDDFQLIAVSMPNQPGVRDVDWHSYQTTVDAIEAQTGYDLLSKLPDQVEWLAEAGISSSTGVEAGQLLGFLSGGVDQMTADGRLAAQDANGLRAKLRAAEMQLSRGHAQPVRGMLGAFTNQVRALVRSGRLAPADGTTLETLAGWVEEAVG